MEEVGRGVGDEGAGEVFAPGEGGMGEIGELLDGGVEGAVEVGDDDGAMVVIADAHDAQGGNPFVKGADAAWKDDENVAMLDHVLLALLQIGGCHNLVA